MKRRDALRMLGLGAALAPLATAAGERLRVLAGGPPSRRVPVCYSPAYVGAAHAFETTRKAAWVAESLRQRPIPGIELVGNPPLAPAQLARVHAPVYIQAVRTGEPRALAESQGFPWDPQLWTMVLASNGGVLKAAAQARQHGVAGALSSGLHHARRERGNGFCTFNGLAVAALAALERGARRVLVLDLDAHCGGGTHSLIAGNERVHQLDVAVDDFDRYQPSGGNTLDRVDSASDYLPTIERRLRALQGQSFDLCLYNAGMDPHQHSPVGGLPGIDAALLARREQRVFAWCAQRRLPIAFVLAGGYIGPALDRPGLVALHRLTLAEAARAAASWPARAA